MDDGGGQGPGEVVVIGGLVEAVKKAGGKELTERRRSSRFQGLHLAGIKDGSSFSPEIRSPRPVCRLDSSLLERRSRRSGRCSGCRRWFFSMRNLSAAAGTLVVLIVAGICMSFAAPASRRLLDSNLNTGRTLTDACFSNASRAIGASQQLLSASVSTAVIQQVAGRLSALGRLPRQLMESIRAEDPDKICTRMWWEDYYNEDQYIQHINARELGITATFAIISGELEGLSGSPWWTFFSFEQADFIGHENTSILTLYGDINAAQLAIPLPGGSLRPWGPLLPGDSYNGAINSFWNQFAQHNQSDILSSLVEIHQYVGFWQTVQAVLQSEGKNISIIIGFGTDVRHISLKFAEKTDILGLNMTLFAVETSTQRLVGVSDGSPPYVAKDPTGNSSFFDNESVVAAVRANESASPVIRGSWNWAKTTSLLAKEAAHSNGENAWGSIVVGGDEFQVAAVFINTLGDKDEQMVLEIPWVFVTAIPSEEIYGDYRRAEALVKNQVENDFADAEELLGQHYVNLAVVLTCSLVALMVLNLVLTRTVAAPVLKLRDQMQYVADLNLEAVTDGSSWLEEIQEMYQAFNLLVKVLREWRKYLPDAVNVDDRSDAASSSSSEEPLYMMATGSPLLPDPMLTSICGSPEPSHFPDAEGGMIRKRSSGRSPGSRSRSTGSGSTLSGMSGSSNRGRSAVGLEKVHGHGMALRKISVTMTRIIVLSADEALSHWSKIVDQMKRLDGVWIFVEADELAAAWNAFGALPSDHSYLASQFALGTVRHNRSADTNTAIVYGNAKIGFVADKASAQKQPVLLGRPLVQVADILGLGIVVGAVPVCDQSCYENVRRRIAGRVVDTYARGMGGEAVPTDRACGTTYIYQLLGAADASEWELHSRAWNAAYAAFLQHRWDEAEQRFSSLQQGAGDPQAVRLQYLSGYFAREIAAERLMIVRPYCRGRVGQGWTVWENNEELRDWFRDASGQESERYRLRTSLASVPEDSGERLRAQLQDGPRSPRTPRRKSMTAQEVRDSRGHLWIRSNKLLGKGAFGEVWLAMGREGELVALKCLRIPPMNVVGRRRGRHTQNPQAAHAAMSKQLDEIVKEVQGLSRMTHENIVAYVGSTVQGDKVWVCTEYIPGGSLHDLLKQFGPLRDSSLKRYMRDVVEGLLYLHSQGVAHRDLKPRNVLLEVDGVCKLADFGSTFMTSLAGPGAAVGSPIYMSPEACSGSFGPLGDIWGAGILLVELATGKVPYELPQPFIPYSFMYRLSNDVAFEPKVPASLSPDALSFVSRCLIREPERRATASELASHEFLM
eukprot:Hpha_TRINITY_DN16748_c0_g1::TRINITY_DN16748_c0_g1_i1::g.77220::m.77220